LLIRPETTEKTAVCGEKARLHFKVFHPSDGWCVTVSGGWPHDFGQSPASTFGFSRERFPFPIRVRSNFVFAMISLLGV
jgi:hypothetical protein